MEENRKNAFVWPITAAWYGSSAAPPKKKTYIQILLKTIMFCTERLAPQKKPRIACMRKKPNRTVNRARFRPPKTTPGRHTPDRRKTGSPQQPVASGRKLGMEGLLSVEDIRRAQESNRYVGREKPLELKKRDVRGLEGETKRRKRSKHKLLPSERKSRLSRAKIERSRKKYLERTAKKELYITDAKGQKISVERLRKLRGLSKNQAVTKRDTDFAKKYQISKRREQESFRANQMRLRKRDEYTR